jgi:uncharacterized membrane protein YfcA
MVLFSFLMLVSALIMYKGNTEIGGKENSYMLLKLIIISIVVVFISGFLGAGGGFIIVPSLVLLLKLPIKSAVGTSLFIIMINSLLGSLTIFQLDYSFPYLIIIPFIIFTVLGMYLASFIQNNIQSKSLQKYFSIFIAMISFFIIIKEMW